MPPSHCLHLSNELPPCLDRACIYTYVYVCTCMYVRACMYYGLADVEGGREGGLITNRPLPQPACCVTCCASRTSPSLRLKLETYEASLLLSGEKLGRANTWPAAEAHRTHGIPIDIVAAMFNYRYIDVFLRHSILAASFCYQLYRRSIRQSIEA